MFFLISLFILGLGLIFFGLLLINIYYALIFFLILLILFVLTKDKWIVIINEYEKGIVLRFGKFVRIMDPGLNIKLPYIETVRKVDMRTQTIDIPPQKVLTKTNVELIVDAVIYFHIIDPIKAILEVKNVREAFKLRVMSTLRAEIGNLHLHEVVENIAKLNERLKKDLEKVSDKWGVSIESVQIQSITISEEVLEAMHLRKSAEIKKEAKKEEALGIKIWLETINEIVSKISNPMMQYLYLETLKKLAEGKSAKIIFPLEFSNIAQSFSQLLTTKLSDKDFRDIIEIINKKMKEIKKK